MTIGLALEGAAVERHEPERAAQLEPFDDARLGERPPEPADRRSRRTTVIVPPVVSALVLVWMDLEMTGLDHTSDVIVEIATIVTDDELKIVAEGPDIVVHQTTTCSPGWIRSSSTCTPGPGCSRRSGRRRRRWRRPAPSTLEFIREHAPEPRTVPLCGNSIGTDRRFLAAYLPEIEDHLHYRSIDVSSIKELVRRWYPKVRQARPQKAGNHRALDDIRDSIDELRYYREHVFVPEDLDASPTADEPTETELMHEADACSTATADRRCWTLAEVDDPRARARRPPRRRPPQRRSTGPTSCSARAATPIRGGARATRRPRSPAWSTPARVAAVGDRVTGW